MRSAVLSSSLVLGCLAALASGGRALAADLPNGPSNYPALAPATDAPASDPWSGLYAGTGISAWGGKGVKGGVGGEGYLGYDHTFDNGVVVGVRASSGYEPFLLATPGGFTRFTGTAFAGGEATVGYRMGPFTPYLIAGVDLARPTAFANGALSPLDAANSALFRTGGGSGGRHGRHGLHLPGHAELLGRLGRPNVQGQQSQQRARALAVLSPPRPVAFLQTKRYARPRRPSPTQ